MKEHLILIYFFIQISCTFCTLVRFQDGLEYVYTYEGTTHLHNVANFTIKGQIGVSSLNKSNSENQLCSLHINSFNMKVTKGNEEHAHRVHLNFTKWFSFEIKPSGEVIAVYYDKKENPFVIIIKKTLLGAISSNLHTTPQTLKSGKSWNYKINETGHDGEQEVSYNAQRNGRHIVFQRTKRNAPIENSKSTHDKEIHYHTELGIPHTIKTKEYFAGPNKAPEGFRTNKGASSNTKFEVTSDKEKPKLPEMSGSAETHVKFVETRKPRQAHRPPPRTLTQDTLKVISMPPSYVPLNALEHFLNTNLTCMRTVRPLHDIVRMKCFQNLIKLVALLSEEDLTILGDKYIRYDIKLDEDIKNREAIVDTLGTVDSSFAQTILTEKVLKAEIPDFNLVMRTLTSFIILRNKPPKVLLDFFELKAFDKPFKFRDDTKTKEVNTRLVLVLGALINEMEHYDPMWAQRITYRLEEKLGLFDKWHHRSLRSTLPQKKIDEFVHDKADLLSALGNAASTSSFHYFQSYVNDTEIPSLLRRNAIRAMSNLNKEEAVDAILVAALTDQEEHVRNEAQVLYRQHPAAMPVTFTSNGIQPAFLNMTADVQAKSAERWEEVKQFVRKIFQGFQFKLNIPGLDWRKQIGSDDIGASFGLTMKNTLEVNIKPLEGFLDTDFHDTAFVTGHLGIISLNVDILKGEVCFKGGIEYDFNILKDLGLNDIKDLIFLYDKIVSGLIGRIKNATIRFNDLVANLESGVNLQKLVAELTENFKQMPYTVQDFLILGETLIQQVSKFSDKAPPVFVAIRDLVVRITTFYKDVKKDVMGFYNSVADMVQVVIPWAAEQIQKAVASIIRGVKSLFKDPKGSVENITKGIARIQAAVVAIIQAKEKIRKTFLFQDKPPYWLDLSAMLNKTLHDVRNIRNAFNSTWQWVKEDFNTSHPMKFFSSINPGEVKKLLYDEMKEVIDNITRPFKPLEVLAKPFVQTFTAFANTIMDIKTTYNDLKSAYTKTKTVIEKIFGPRFQKKFPRKYVKPDSSCGPGFYPSKGLNNHYALPGVILEVESGKPITMPMTGTVVKTGTYEVTITTSELKNVVIVISNIEVVSENENKMLFRGQELGYPSTTSTMCSEYHIHVAMRSSVDVDQHIDPTRYLERREIPPPKWKQRCDDYKLSVFGKVIQQGSLTQGPKNKTVSPERPKAPDVSDLPEVHQERLAYLDKVKEYARNFSNFLGFNISSDGPIFNFSMNHVKIDDALTFLKQINETEDLIKNLTQLMVQLKIQEDNIRGRCVKPQVMSMDELKQKLKEQNKTSNGTKDFLINQLIQHGDLCQNLTRRLNQLDQNIYCTFEEGCLGLSCCVDVKLFMFEVSLRAFVRVNPCTLNITLGFYNWSKEFSVARHNFAKEFTFPIGMPEKLEHIFDQAYLQIAGSISKQDNNLTVSFAINLCSNKTDECRSLKVLLDKAYIVIPGCDESKYAEKGIISYQGKAVLTAPYDISDILALTFLQLQTRIEKSRISSAVVTKLLNELREIHEAVVKFYIDTALNSFMNPNQFKMHDLCLSPKELKYTKEQKFFEYQFTVMLGFFPISFAFGAYGNWGVNFETGICLLQMKATGLLTPQVGAHVYGALRIGFGLVGEIQLDGYLLTTSFPIKGEVGFGQFPFTVGARMDLVLVPLRLELHGLLTFDIKIYREVLFDKLIWEYSTPSITANMFILNDLKPDDTPPKFFVYRPKKVEWKDGKDKDEKDKDDKNKDDKEKSEDASPGGKKKRSISQELDLPERPKPVGYCYVEQLKNRDYADPAFLLEMDVDDDESEITMSYCIGVNAGGCDVAKDEPLSGSSTIIPSSLGGGFPLFFTVTATNSAKSTSQAVCNLTIYDVTPPTGRISSVFATTSNPRTLMASAAILDETPVILKKISVGFGKSSYGDQIIPWTELQLTQARYSADADYKTFFTEGRRGRIIDNPIERSQKADVNVCAKDCFNVPKQKCLSFNYDQTENICELLKVVENNHISLHQYKTFYNYERLIIGKTLEFTYDDLELKHNNLYYFNMWLENRLGYTNIISSKAIMVDFTIPEPGLVNIKQEKTETIHCRQLVISDWSGYCQGDSPFPNHRLIIDGPGSKTIFNGKERLVENLYQRANTYIAANWDGFHDKESGLLGYAIAIGTEPCSTNIYPFTNVNKGALIDIKDINIGIAHPLQLRDGKYYVTVRAYNNIEYGGPMAVTVCHSTPVTVDNTPPIIDFVGEVLYDETTHVITVHFSMHDPESNIKGVEIAVGKSLHDNLILEWDLSNMTDEHHSKYNFKLPDGVSCWIKVRAINNVDLKTAKHAPNPVLVDMSPPIPGYVYDGFELGENIDYQNINNKICVNWDNFQDPESGIGHYLWGVGTRPGLDDVLQFHQYRKTDHQACKPVRQLQQGRTYYSTITAFNEGLNVKQTSVSSSGVLYDGTPPQIGWIKDGLDPNNEMRFSSEPASVTANWDNFIDPESHIKKYNVNVYKAGAASPELISGDKIVDKDSKSLSWHSFHNKHGDHIKVKVSAINGADLSSYGFSRGFTMDLTPPKLVYIGDGNQPRRDIKYMSSKTSLSANWLFEDHESGIDSHKVSIYEVQTNRRIQIYPENGWKIISSRENIWTSRDPLDLIDGRTYSVRVMAVNGAGLSAVIDTNGVIVDSTPPKMELVKIGVPLEESEDVYDGFVLSADQTQILASWRGRDAESGIASYHVGVGTSPTQPDISPFHSMGTEDYGYIKDLNLNHYDERTQRPLYYVIIKAENQAGLFSQIMASKPIKIVRVDQPGIVTDGPECETADGHTIGVDKDYQFDYLTVTACFQGFESQQHGIVRYIWAVGTQPNLEDVKPFSPSGIVVDSIDRNPGNGIAGGGRAQDILLLETDKNITYYVTVRAITGANNIIESVSNGFQVVTAPPSTHFKSLGAHDDNATVSIDSSATVYQKSTAFITASWEYYSMSGIQYAGYVIGTYPGGDNIRQVKDCTNNPNIINDEVQPMAGGAPNIITVATENQVGFWDWTSSGSIIVDNSPPLLGELICPEFANKFSSITCSWRNFNDLESDIGHYVFGVGTEESTDNIYKFTKLTSDVFSYTTAEFNVVSSDEVILHYYVTLAAVNKAGVSSSAYAQLTIDHTEPLGGHVIAISDLIDPTNFAEYTWPISCSKMDCGQLQAICQKSLTQVVAAWEPFKDPESHISSYEVGVGSTRGGTQIKRFVKAEEGSFRMVIDGLDLSEVQQVFVTVKGTNAAGLSNVSTSNGIYISRMSSGLEPLGKSVVYDGNVEGKDLDLQDQSNTIFANWQFDADLCPIKKYEWAITRMDGKIIQPMTEVPHDKKFAQNNEVGIQDGSTVFVTVRATNWLDYTYSVRSNGITISLEDLLPGFVRDGEVPGSDINYQRSITTLSANWDTFGESVKGESRVQQMVHHYEVSAGTDPRSAETRSNIHPFHNVGLNRVWIFKNLLLTPKTVTYYMTVRAYSVSGAVTEITSNGVHVGFGGSGMSQGHAHIPRYISSFKDLTFSWHEFNSDMDILWSVWGMSSKDLSRLGLHCDEMQSFDANHESVNEGKFKNLFDIQPLTNIGKETAVELSNLNLKEQTTYSILIMVTDEAAECSQVVNKVTVDTSPPNIGRIKTGAFYDTPVQYASDPSFLIVSWEGFTDEESGIQAYEIALFKSEECRQNKDTGSKKLIDFIELSPNITTFTIFLDTPLEPEKPYFIHMKTTNNAGLSVSAVSPPIILDNDNPSVGDVIDGIDIEHDLTHQSSTDYLSGSFRHLPNRKNEVCPSKFEARPGNPPVWNKVTQSKLFGHLDLDIRYHPNQVQQSSDSLVITMARDTSANRMLTGAMYREIEVDSGSLYEVEVKAAAGQYNAVTSVTIWDGPPGRAGDFDFKLDITTVRKSKVLARTQDGTHYSSINENEFDYELPDITYRACGLQLHPDVVIERKFYHFVVIWCTFANGTSEAISEAAQLPFNPADGWHKYSLKVKKEKLSANLEDWSLELQVNNTLKVLLLTGIPGFGRHARLLLHVWNRDNYIPQIQDRFSLPSTSAYFKNTRVPGEQKCRSVQPFINGKYSIIKFLVGIGTKRGIDDVSKFTPAKDPNYCIPCLNKCDVYICDPNCDDRKVSTYHVTVSQHLKTFMEYQDDGAIKSAPALYYLNVKAVPGSGRYVMGSSNGIYIDVSPPVFNYSYAVDEDWSHNEPTSYQGSSKSISVKWAAFDLESEVSQYEWAIGSRTKSYDIQPFENVGLRLEATNSNLEGVLRDRQTYYITVKAINGALLEAFAEITVTVRFSNPDISGASTRIEGRMCSSVNNVMICKEQSSLGLSWTKANDDAVNAYYFSVGSSSDSRVDIVPEIRVGVNDGGRVEIRDGSVLLNNQKITDLSSLYTGLEDNSKHKNTLFMEPGKVVHMFLRACSAAHKCADVPVKPVIIGGQSYREYTAPAGQYITADVQINEADFRINVPQGRQDTKVLVVNTLDHHSVNKNYLSSASDMYKSYISDPEETKNSVTKSIHARIDRWLGNSFFVALAGGSEYNIQITTRRDFGPGLKLLHWNPDMHQWEDSASSCATAAPSRDSSHQTIRFCPNKEATQFALATVSTRVANNPPRLMTRLSLQTPEDSRICKHLKAIDPDGDEVIFKLPENAPTTTRLGRITLGEKGRLCFYPCKHCHGTERLKFLMVENRDSPDKLITEEEITIDIIPQNDIPEIIILINGKAVTPNNHGEIWVNYEQNNQNLKVVVMAYEQDDADNIRLEYNRPKNFGHLVHSNQVLHVQFEAENCNHPNPHNVHDMWTRILNNENSQSMTLPYPCDLHLSSDLRILKWTLQVVTYVPLIQEGVDIIQVVALDEKAQSHPVYLTISILLNNCRDGRHCNGGHGAVCTQSDCSHFSHCRCQ